MDKKYVTEFVQQVKNYRILNFTFLQSKKNKFRISRRQQLINMKTQSESFQLFFANCKRKKMKQKSFVHQCN